MKIKNTRYGNPAQTFVSGIDGVGPSPFSEIDFLNTKKGGETTLQKIGSEEYDSIVESVERAGLMPMPAIMNRVNQIISVERNHRRELEALAIETVVMNFGLPEEVRELLEARLDTENDLDCTPDDEDEEEPELSDRELEVAEELVKRRILQNALMMGSGYRAHKLFANLKESLDLIDPMLFPMYEEFLPSVEYYLWKFELPPSMRVNWGKCEIKEEDGTVKGKATAKVFIILLHEVAKIAVELLFLQSVVDIQDQYGEHVKKYVIMNADKYEDEQWMKLIGPRMWKHLHDCMDYIVKAKGNDYTVVAYLLNSIGVLYPENFFLVTDMILNDGEKAIVLLEEMYDQIMEEIEVFRQQEEEAPKKKVRKGRGKKARNISDYTVDELNKILEDAVESEEFEKAAYIKAELDKR
jgi:hypothetical protein